MAIKLSDQYPGRADAPSIDYPNGSFKNRSAPGVLDGTPLDKVWANDKEGFFQGILAEAGIAADGLPDKVGASQYLEALITVIKDNPPEQATESISGIAKIATSAIAGALTNNTDIITPARLASALNIRVGHSFTANDWIKLPGGLIVQWGTLSHATADGTTVALTFPIAFPNACFTANANEVTLSQAALVAVGNKTATGCSFLIANRTGGTAVGNALNWFAIGW